LSKETDPQHQSSKNKNWSRRLIAVAFFAIFVSSVVFTAWTLFYWLDHFLKEKQTYGSVVVEPFQYSRDHILSHHWDSILVYSPPIFQFQSKSLIFEFLIFFQANDRPY
jgi:magnesium-transporting ATPase (P-type)